jgi:hypothetical protein
MLRFVLLYHDCPPGYVRRSHWDFMLESGDVLRSWALPELPAAWQKAQQNTAVLAPRCAPTARHNEVEVERLSDHRRAYLEYGGPISGNRGHVVRIDSGTYTTQSESPQCWKLELTGQLVRGQVELRQISPGQPHWMLQAHEEA